MTIEFAKTALDARIRDAGLLINLLSETGDELSLNEQWFSDPFSTENLAGVGTRGNELVNLVVDFVGDAVDDPPNSAAWHPIKFKDKATGLNLVVDAVPEGAPTSTTLSLGMFHSIEISESPKTNATVYFVFPALEFTAGGWSFVLGKESSPAQVVGEIVTKASFSSGGKTFNKVRITGNFVLDGSLPNFKVEFVATDSSTVDFTSLKKLLDASATEWIDAALGLSGVTSFLDTKIGSSSTESIGSVLKAVKLLNEGTPYTVADLKDFLNQTPENIAKELLHEALTILATQEKPLIPVGEDGGFWVVKSSEGPTDLYGIRVTMPDVGKSAGTGTGDKKDAPTLAATPKEKSATDKNKPQATLQIGKWFTGESNASESWLKRVDPALNDDQEPGAFIYLLKDDAGTFSFAPRIELVSVGFDYIGGNDSPLIDVKGVKLGGFEPRLYLAMDLTSTGPANLAWGGGIRLDDMGLPLSGDFDKKTGDNAVASNLLASGGGEGGDAAKGKEDAVNPSFSVSVAGMTSELSVQLYGPDNAQTDRIWFPINRSFGPLNCKKVGIEWIDSDRFLSTLFDGGVTLGALDVELMGLSVGMKVTEPTNLSEYKLGLDGLNINYSSPSIEISGGFLKDTTAEPVAYNGQARVKAGAFGLGALGSYTTLPDDGKKDCGEEKDGKKKGGKTSMFVFAFIDYPLGGPGFFFITGLAGGFGYNRSLKMPEQDKVLSMPLVGALKDPSKIGGKDATPTKALSSLKDWVPATRGQNFIAAGIKFTTYELVNSIALLAVQFGERLEIDLLGVSTIKLPPAGPTFAYAELDLLVVIAPDDGVFKASLVLGPESFVLDPKCKLTGGFAFYAWFGSNKHAGDFVVTLGGYHPSFKPPDYYPSEPRLGFNWPVTDSLTISGGLYFALTPSCIMGGGALAVTFASGGLKAWFTAHADLIIYWKPFFFDASIGVSLGASYTFKVFGAKVTLGVSLGAELELWGPPTGGKVHVSWFIISFTIGFGEPKPLRLPTIDWSEFVKTLPSPGSAAAPAGATTLTENADVSPKVVSINIAEGLTQQLTEDGEQVWFVRPDEFTWFTKTTIPATEALLGTTKVTENNAGVAATTQLGIRPMGVASISDGSHSITVDGPDDISAFMYDLDLEDQPDAMWGEPVTLKDLEPAAKLVKNCITGVKGLHPKHHAEIVGPPIIDAAKAFTFVLLDKGQFWLPINVSYRPPSSGGAQPSADTLDTIHDTLVQEAPIRSSVFASLAAMGLNAGANGDLTHLAANPTAAFTASPMKGAVA